MYDGIHHEQPSKNDDRFEETKNFYTAVIKFNVLLKAQD